MFWCPRVLRHDRNAETRVLGHSALPRWPPAVTETFVWGGASLWHSWRQMAHSCHDRGGHRLTAGGDCRRCLRDVRRSERFTSRRFKDPGQVKTSGQPGGPTTALPSGNFTKSRFLLLDRLKNNTTSSEIDFLQMTHFLKRLFSWSPLSVLVPSDWFISCHSLCETRSESRSWITLKVFELGHKQETEPL